MPFWFSPPLPPPPPDLECPECGWLDGVPVRAVERSRLERGVVVSRAVGKVYRCAKCVCEYIVGPSGVYRPQVATPREADNPKPPKRDEPLMLRDTDQQWERHRKR